MQRIIGDESLISVETIAGMLQALAPPNIDKNKIDWRANATRAIAAASDEAAKNGGTTASAEHMSSQIFTWALSERAKIMEAAH